MMKKLAFLLALLPVGAFAQTGAIQGYCNLGGTTASLSGMQSVNTLQGIIPHCTVTVYLTGTSTLATIYANVSSTPLSNPFTANTVSSLNSGAWIFWAAVNQGYDVVMSGGGPPVSYPSPVTLTDLFASSVGISSTATAVQTMMGPLYTPQTATGNSPHVDIEFWGALPTNSAAVNRAAIDTAIGVAESAGADVFTPVGTFPIDQMITATGVCLDGQSELGSVWQLHTTTNVNAVLFINGGSHNCVRDMTITTDSTSSQYVTIADLYVLDDAQGDYERIITGSANNSTGDSFKMLGGVSDHTSLITSIASNWPSGSGNLPLNGQYYGADGGRCSCPVTIDSPVVGGGAHSNFELNGVEQFTVTGMQNSGGILSTDVENSLDGSISGLVSEAASGTDGVIVNGSHDIVFTGASTGSSTANFHIESSYGTTYENSLVGSPILIDSGARGTKLDTLELVLGNVYAPDIADNAPDTTMANFTDSFGNSAFGGVPKFCSTLGGSTPPGTRTAFIAPIITNTAFTTLCLGQVGAPAHWFATFTGVWQSGGCGGAGLPRLIEVSDTSPTITCGASVVTISLQSGILSAKETTGTASLLFQGVMLFEPSNGASGAAGTSEWLLGAIEADGGLIVGGNTVVPSKSTGFHGTGSGDVKVQMSDGSGTSAHLAAFNSTGGLTDGGAAQPASVSGSLTYTTATSDAATVTGATASSHCTFSPTNSTAAAATVLGYISTVTTNSVTITHVATSANGGTVDIVCTVN